MAYQYNQRVIMQGSGSTNTSPPWFVGDFRLLTISFSSTGSLGPSRFTVEGSNADGFATTADMGNASQTTSWSLISGINMIGVTPGMVTFDPPGYRWIRTTTTPLGGSGSTTSATTLIANGISF